MTETDAIKLTLKRLKVVNIQPGDTLVIEMRENISDIAYKQVIEALFRAGYKALILERAYLKAVLRPSSGLTADEVPGR